MTHSIQTTAQKYLLSRGIDALTMGKILQSINLKKEWDLVRRDIDYVLLKAKKIT